MKKMTFEIADFAVVRTPLLSTAVAEKLWDLDVSSVASSNLERHPSSAPEIRKQLKHLLDEREVAFAIAVASKSLFRRLNSNDWGADHATLNKTELSLLKYVYRAAFRCTPFGMFAGFSVVSTERYDEAKINCESGIQLAPQSQFAKHTRIDSALLTHVADKAILSDGFSDSIGVSLNPTISVRPGSWRFIEATRLDERQRQFTYSMVERNPVLDETFSYLSARHDFVPLSTLANHLCEELEDFKSSELLPFLRQLIAEQVLVTSLEVPLSADNMSEEFVDSLMSAGLKDRASQIQDLQRRVNTIGQNRGNSALLALRDLEEYVSGAFPDYSGQSTFQLNLERPASAASLVDTLHSTIQDTVFAASRLAIQESTELQEFCDRFRQRYEGAAVPLLDALDPVVGIGYGLPSQDDTPMLKNLNLVPLRGTGSDGRSYGIGPADSLLFRKYEDALRLGRGQIATITESDLRALPERFPSTATQTSFFINCSVLGDAADDRKNPPTVLVSAIGGTSGIQTIARFTGTNRELQNRVRAFLTAEDEHRDADALHPEILHFPHARSANVIARPRLRDTELPVFGISRADTKTVLLRNLNVRVNGNMVEIWDTTTNKRVYPRLSSAHNPRGLNISIYTFLCDLQRQGAYIAGFAWPTAIKLMASYTPRLVFKNTILMPATWRLSKARLKSVLSCKPQALRHEMDKLMMEESIPDKVEIVFGDNALPINLRSTHSLEVFLKEAKRSQQLILSEQLRSSGDNFVRTADEPFAHEIVIPLIRSTAANEPARATVVTPASKLDSQEGPVYAPGSNWLYAKIYTGTSFADEILATVFDAVNVGGRMANVVDKWFFLRYSDPDFHVRIRFHGHPDELTSKVMPWLQETIERFYAEFQIFDYQLATYFPEYVRYGGAECMEEIHDIFFRDSVLAAHLLTTRDLFGNDRFFLKCQLIDTYWSWLGLSAEERLAVYGSYGYASGRAAGDLKFSIDAKYRRTADALNAALDDSLSKDHSDNTTHQYLSQLRIALEKLCSLSESGHVQKHLYEVVSSIVHMSLNRIALSNGTTQERLAYEFLRRYYRAKVERQKRL